MGPPTLVDGDSRHRSSRSRRSTSFKWSPILVDGTHVPSNAVDATKVLQWGRRFSSTETTYGAACAVFDPTLLQWSRRLSSTETILLGK
jgi:hypothetical protein